MSKVYEALKRAREERELAARDGDDAGGLREVEVTSAVMIDATGPVGTRSAASRVSVSTEDHQIEKTPLAASSLAVEVESASFIDGTSTIAPKITAPAPDDHKPQSSDVGRDPKTGQFLRFEDLLRACPKPTWVLDPKTVVFCESSSRTSGAEQFRTLRSRLYQLRESSKFKKLLITSAVASEGKTFVSTNLSQAIARERDRRVLLIDADLRNPSLHKPLGAPLSPGLSDYLRDQASDAEIIQHGQDGKLCFIPAGSTRDSPSELLSNAGFEKLLDRLAPLFDWIIIDSPPCLPVADANVLAAQCDGVLLVVRAESTPWVAVERAGKELRKRNLVGVVLNAVEEAHVQDSYYYQGSGERL